MGSAVRTHDPLLELARVRSSDRPWLLFAIAVAAVVHVATAWTAARVVRRQVRAIEPLTEVVDIDIPKPPPPVEPPKPEEPPQSKAPEPPPKAAAPPPPAQAAAVVTRAPDPNEPVDLTGGFVTGSAETYAGGTTTSVGTNPSAVRLKPVATGTPMGTGAPAARPAAPTGPDRSKRPTLGGGGDWQCPFPSEADVEQVDHAVVTLRVEVDVSGTAKGVTVMKDPGHGFGREARRCALTKKWSPALDHDGAAAPGTAVINVRFDR